MSAIPARRPFLPNEARREKPGSVIGRAATVAARAEFNSLTLDAVATRYYPNDSLVPHIVTKAAVSPAALSSVTALAGSVTVDFISSMTGQSAAARLIDVSPKLTFDGRASISIPSRATAPSADVAWTSEGAPMPVLSFTLNSLTLQPYKLAAAAAATREVTESTNAESVIGQLLKEDLAYSLDASLFSATAASAARPAGLLNGLTTLGATTGGTTAAMNTDIGKLFTSIASVGNVDDIVLVASPSQAAALSLQPRSGELRVFSTRALSAGTILAVDTAGFISAFSPLPRIEASGDAMANFEDTTPVAVGTAGSPNVVAAPLRSAMQTDCVIVRCILSASWVVRPGAVQMITSTSW